MLRADSPYVRGCYVRLLPVTLTQVRVSRALRLNVPLFSGEFDRELGGVGMRTRQVALGEIGLTCNEEPGGEPLFLMLHGLTGHRDDFRDQLPALADLGWILAPDLRGHGNFTQTGRAETFDFATLIDDQSALLDAEGVDRCDLLGHSFGGMLALRFALAYPERVSSLVLMSTAPFAPDGYSREMFEKVGAIACARGMAFLQERAEQASRANTEPTAADRQVEKWADAYWIHHRLRYTAMDPVGYRELSLCMMDQESLIERLAEITCPTTVVVGAADGEFLRGSRALGDGIPNAKLVELPDAGHHPHMENPEGWLRAIREHLERARG